MQPALVELSRTLITGNYTAIATVARTIGPLWDEVVKLVTVQIACECSALCQKSPSALLRSMSVEEMETFSWATMMSEIRRLAPTLLQILMVVSSSNDHRNSNKTGSAHDPGICMTLCILLKERCTHIIGLQSLISLLLYMSNTNKVVSDIAIHLQKFPVDT